MRLRDLNASFIRYETRADTWTRALGDPSTYQPGDPTEQVTGPREYMLIVDTLDEAQGVRFDCPKCGGTHPLDVTFADRGVADAQGTHNTAGEPTRWAVAGTGLDDLTTRPSVLIEGGCGWHGFITDGAAA